MEFLIVAGIVLVGLLFYGLAFLAIDKWVKHLEK
jgi:hypothetical protein